MRGLLTFCKHGVPLWLLKVLTRYPSYQALRNAGVEGLSQIALISKKSAAIGVLFMHKIVRIIYGTIKKQYRL